MTAPCLLLLPGLVTQSPTQPCHLCTNSSLLLLTPHRELKAPHYVCRFSVPTDVDSRWSQTGLRTRRTLIFLMQVLHSPSLVYDHTADLKAVCRLHSRKLRFANRQMARENVKWEPKNFIEDVYRADGVRVVGLPCDE